MEVSEDIKSVLQNLSNEPGVYHFYDAKEALLYVGKAKNLKRRVSSYFNRKHNSFKTAYMVRKIHRIETLVVDTEMDALLLENNLIKNTNLAIISYSKTTKPTLGFVSKKNLFIEYSILDNSSKTFLNILDTTPIQKSLVLC